MVVVPLFVEITAAVLLGVVMILDSDASGIIGGDGSDGGDSRE